MSSAEPGTASLAVAGIDKLTDRKRADILDAAIACFSENGFDNASMDAIASQANVSKKNGVQPLFQQRYAVHGHR